MTIKDLENELLISRANIRFYEKEGLLSPNRKENKYRDYNDNDISRLQKIIVLRKLGVSVTDIKSILDGNESLQKVVHEQSKILTEKIEELKGALDVCKQIEDDNVDIDNFDEAYYIDIIQNKEKQGQSFVDIYKDYLNFELFLFGTMWKYAFLYNFDKSRKKHGLKKALVIIFILCIIRGLSSCFIWQESFWEGFLYPFELFILGSAIILPIYILSKKHPKIAYVISSIFLIAAMTFLAAIFILIIVLVLNSLLHFWN